MQSHKIGHRSDARNRTPHRPAQDQTYPKIVDPKLRKVGAVQAAARVANLKLLLSRVEGDLVMLAAAVQLDLTALKQRLEGLEVVEDGSAMYIEETLALDPGWLDGKHSLSDISPKTVDILYGRGISESEEEIRQSEQKGHEIMKNAQASAAAANRAPQTSGVEKPSEETIVARIANLTMLTQARGAKSRLARLLQVSESIVSFLFNRNKDFTNRFTRELETSLGLPAYWFDTVQEIHAVPQATWDILGSAAKSAPSTPKQSKAVKAPSAPGLTLSMNTAPTELEKATRASAANAPKVSTANAPLVLTTNTAVEGASNRAPRVHRVPGPRAQEAGNMPLQLATRSAPSVLQERSGVPETLPELDEADVVHQPVAATDTAPMPESETPTPAAAAAAPAPTAPVVSVRARRVVAPAAVAPAPAIPNVPAQAPAPAAAAPVAPAPAAQPVQAPAPVVAAAPAINTRLESRADMLIPETFVIHPITEALIKTLTIKAREGKFGEKEALRLLTEIAEL